MDASPRGHRTPSGDAPDRGTDPRRARGDDPLASPAVRFARWGGALYAGLGIVGFGVTGFGEFLRTTGESLGVLEVNPLQNLLHLTVGLALMAAGAAGPEPARIVSLVAATSMGVAGLLGFALTGTDGNVLALNHAANLLHLGTAFVAAVCLAATTRVRAPA